MAYGQIDPARLDGDALTRWYLRSPADIEQERQASAAQAYDNFFSINPALSPTSDSGAQGGNTPAGASDVQTPASTPAQDIWQGQPASSDDANNGTAWTAAYPVGDGIAPPTTTRVAANGWVCVGCHGTGIAPPPPMASKPWATPWRPGPNLTPRTPAKPPPPQCAMQSMNDSRICSREPNTAWQSVCLQSASEREAHCLANDGQIGWPPLETHDRR